MAFGKRLDDDQIRIKRFGITISDKDKLQFYLEQMYASNHFDKKEMTEWENKSIATKDDFDEAKLYFEGLVKDYEVYAQNSGGTAGKHNFESAYQAAEADAGDELRKYIAGVAQAAVTQEEQAANIRDSTKASSDAMAAQIKTKSDQIAQLTKAIANKENTPSGGGGGLWWWRRRIT
jgi:predicted phage tail protein